MPFFECDSWNLVSALLIALGIQAVFFVIAASLRSDAFTDITYSLTFAVLVLLLLRTGASPRPEGILVAVLICLWSLRLGGYLLVRILRTGRDERFDGIRESFRRFGVFWLFQGISIWVILLPVTLALGRADGWAWTPAILGGAGVWAAGFLLEAVSDHQKFRFRNRPENRGRFIQTGLWRYSRHPNYFGEMLCWWGLFLICTPALRGWQWFSAVGPLFLTLLLRFGTGVPTVARKQQQKYGQLAEFRRYLATTNLLVPWFPRKPG